MKLMQRTTNVCRRLQHTLAEEGPTALRDDETAQQHLEDCDDCFRILEALNTLDAGFDAMPALDAPDELVEGLLGRIAESQGAPADLTSGSTKEDEATTEARPAVAWIRAALRPLLGTNRPRLRATLAFAMLALISTSVWLNNQIRKMDQPHVAVEVHGSLANAEHRVEAGAVRPERLRVAEELAKTWDVEVTAESPELDRQKLGALADLSGAAKKIVDQEPESVTSPVTFFSNYREASTSPETRSHFSTEYRGNQPIGSETKGDRVATGGTGDLPVWVGTEVDITFRGGSPRVEPGVEGLFDGDDEARERVRDRLRERLQNLPRGLQDSGEEPTPEQNAIPVKGVDLKPNNAYIVPTQEPPAFDPSRDLAQRFLAERDAVDLAGQPASGYWVNSYVPGDPVMRHLQAQLAANDATRLIPAWRSHPEPPLLHGASRRTTQPFDPPTDTALAIQLQTDRSTIIGESRMLVQIGLAGTPRRWGRRSTMNVAVVLDLSGNIPPATGASLVALAAAFGEARDANDRFRLIAAGRGGGELVTPKDFHRGPVVVAATEQLATAGEAGIAPVQDMAPADTTALSLVEALRLAIAGVADGDDPNAPLGASAIVLATSRALGGDAAEIAALAHYSAVAGIPVSIVGVGNAVDLDELESLALAGQGSRRLLREPADARGLVDRELAGADRAVARAVRLRVRLAPGVRLIDVVGSRRHTETGAERVREAERAIDQRLARSLGIEADRGDDEAGIQIVIPTFYAEDHHVILLDVVAPGPGPIADVTVRFKDLVQLENAVVRDHLTVGRGEGGRGPLERNVLKNLLAHRLRDIMEDAAKHVAANERQAAAELLTEYQSLLSGLRLEVNGFGRDPDFDRDLAMLHEYIDRVSYRWLETPEHRRYLADSLRYAARLKVLPAPVPVTGTG